MKIRGPSNYSKLEKKIMELRLLGVGHSYIYIKRDTSVTAQ
jgi:hypothetical protein